MGAPRGGKRGGHRGKIMRNRAPKGPPGPPELFLGHFGTFWKKTKKIRIPAGRIGTRAQGPGPMANPAMGVYPPINVSSQFVETQIRF